MRGKKGYETRRSTSGTGQRRMLLLILCETLLVLILIVIAVMISPSCLTVDQLRHSLKRQLFEEAKKTGIPTSSLPQSRRDRSLEASPPKIQQDRTKNAPKSLELPRYPKAWLPSGGDECHEYRGNTLCEGPRKVPLPWGDAAELARTLGLGTRATASHLLLKEPEVEWILAVEGSYTDIFYWPVSGGFLGRGLRLEMKNGTEPRHNGVDIGASRGTLIHAVADGLVAYSDNKVAGYGNLLMVIHYDGSLAMYAHCDAIFVFAGEQVHQGQVVGEVGSTGISRGTHLHFELRKNGEPVDPLPMLLRGQRLQGMRIH